MTGRDPQILAACLLVVAHNSRELVNLDSHNVAIAALDIYDSLEAEAKKRLEKK